MLNVTPKLPLVRWVVCGCLLASICACQDYPFAYRPNQRVAVTTVREVVIRNANTDILFVIDDSHSMLEEQIKLVENTGAFIEQLVQSENEYRVSIMTTNALDESRNFDPDQGQDGGRLRMRRATDGELSAANPDFGLVDPITGNPVDLGLNIPCANTTRDPFTSGLLYLERPDLDSTNLAAERCHLIKDFMATVASLGVDGSGREAGLEAARRGLGSDDADVVAHNSGFLRAEADLALVFLSDEDDCSLTSYANNWPNRRCYDTDDFIPPAAYLDFFAGLKGEAGVRKVRAALIGGGVLVGETLSTFAPRGCRIDGGAASSNCGCWNATADDFFCQHLNGFGQPCAEVSSCPESPARHWALCTQTAGGTCDIDTCEAMPGSRYSQFIDGLGQRRREVGFPRGTYQDSICQESYDATLRAIAQTVVLSTCFTFDEPALSATQIRVIHRHTDPDSLKVSEQELPRFDASDATACQSCGDCPDGAWVYNHTPPAAPTICLECGLTKDTGDDFLITIVNEVVGIDGGPIP